MKIRKGLLVSILFVVGSLVARGQTSWPFAPPPPTVVQEYRVSYALKRGGVVTDVKVDTLQVNTARVYATEAEVLSALRRKQKRRLRGAKVVLIHWQFVRYRFDKRKK